MRFRNSLALIFSFFLLYNFGNTTDELPIPTYNNSVIISIELNPWDSDEVDYIKENFNFGMYAWLSISHTHIAPVLDWHSDWSNPSQEIKGLIGRGIEFNIASEGISSFKDFVNSLIEKAKEKNVLLHIVLCSGMARSLSVYEEAKEEDIRNCQWFNDNKLASDDQYNTDPDFLNKYVFGTVSRYARKMRANVEAKAKAVLAFLKQKMDENPDVLIAISGWGELELNFLRTDHSTYIQDHFCDFSPFAVMEFRDWICHTGMYDDETGKYLGQGYSEGGAKYQGQDGLNQFNQDFGTNFTTWDLKYYNWSLSDDYDENPEDYINNDPNRIPISEYDHGNMLSAYRANYTEGGFDPPRVMGHPEDYEGHSKFWDLFNLFRETMVHNAVKDMAKWAYEAGISTEKWYSHGIPGDYLYGYNPDMPYKNARYYSSGSPLWASNINPYGSMGATIYDIKFPTYFVRTTQYGVPAISSMSTNWAIMEYDPETYPVGFSVTPSTADFILEQFLKTYGYYCHFYNFWKWLDDTGEHRIKGTNKETALKNFIVKIKDKARMAVNTIFDPPKVTGFSGQYSSSAGGAHAEAGEAGSMKLELTGKIWDGYSWEWTDWGDFSYFAIHRSTEHNFTPSSSTWLSNTSDYSYEDSSIASGKAYFYRIRAINSNGGAGPYSDELMLLPSSENVPVLHVDKKNLTFKVSQAHTLSTSESVNIENLGVSGTILNWQASSNQSWLSVTPISGTGNAAITVSVDTTGLALGTHSGEVKVEDPNALNSPQLIEVLLSLVGTDINLPFGSFDTPVDGSTVSGSISVTGWALDDIGVSTVQIKRSSHPDDPPGAIGPDGLVYIGDGIFVKGARPDLEDAFPDYPQNDRAGWGYMMLTNFLPNEGNGTFILYAYAYDESDNVVELGRKTIHCDNTNRVKPFGTLDTPAQGGTASGNSYINFGWALTPLPKHIPEDGSTIWIYIDSYPVGNPVYNQYREDIANAFPGYLNSDGAVGFFYINTTEYPNGTHTISWTVIDNEGASDGIGSRYFEIQNTSGDAKALADMNRMSHKEDLTGRLKIEVETKGRQRAEGRRQKALSEGKIEIEIEELEIIKLQLRGESGSRFIGWTADEYRNLPIGSTLDNKTGIFYWMPGPGFLGKHILNFAVTNGKFRSKPVEITINIIPKKYQKMGIEKGEKR